MNRKISISYGIIAGVATVGYYLLFYFFNRASFFDLYIWWGGILPMIVFMFLGGIAQRKANGGELTFRTALTTTFLVFMVSSLLFYIFYYILLKYIDPDLLRVQQETALANLERFSNGKDKDLRPYQEFYEEEDLSIAIRPLVFRYVQSLIGGFILSLLAAFTLKTK
ncbi:MAG: hypothetical protein Sapg2KO_20220 [Saprospiraceae bacterium]